MTYSFVTERLCVTDIKTVRGEQTPSIVDVIVTVCQDDVRDHVPDDASYEFFNMSDGEDMYGGNSTYALFERATDTVVRHLEDGDAVLVHCHMGQSRSVTVAAAALATTNDMSAFDALAAVDDVRPQTNPNQKLLGHLQRYVES